MEKRKITRPFSFPEFQQQLESACQERRQKFQKTQEAQTASKDRGNAGTSGKSSIIVRRNYQIDLLTGCSNGSTNTKRNGIYVDDCLDQNAFQCANNLKSEQYLIIDKTKSKYTTSDRNLYKFEKNNSNNLKCQQEKSKCLQASEQTTGSKFEKTGDQVNQSQKVRQLRTFFEKEIKRNSVNISDTLSTRNNNKLSRNINSDNATQTNLQQHNINSNLNSRLRNEIRNCINKNDDENMTESLNNDIVPKFFCRRSNGRLKKSPGRSLNRSHTHCYHFPSNCPLDSPTNITKHNSDQFFKRVCEGGKIPDLKRRLKSEDADDTENQGNHHFLCCRLKDLKKKSICRRISSKKKNYQKDNEDSLLMRRSSSKRKRIKQEKLQKKKDRTLDLGELCGFLSRPMKDDQSSKRDVYSYDITEEDQDSQSDCQRKINRRRAELREQIRRVERILDFFLTQEIISHPLYYQMLRDECSIHDRIFDHVIENGEKAYQYFVKALKLTGQDYLVELLENEDYILDISHHPEISRNVDDLVHDVILSGELLNHLTEKGLLNQEESETLNNLQNTPHRQNRSLFYFMYRSSRKQFDLFKDCLILSNQESVVSILESNPEYSILESNPERSPEPVR